MRFWIVVWVCVLISCNEIRQCDLATSRDFAVIAFYEADSTFKYRKDTIFVGDILNPVDTLTPFQSLNAIALELNPTDTAINYLLELNGTSYSLQLAYEKRLEIYYEECEPIFTYKLDSIYSPDFDSVALIANPLDEAIPINVEIYF